jgi:hypothetical protein
LASTWANAETLAPKHKMATAADAALRAENFTCFIENSKKKNDRDLYLIHSCFCMFQFRDNVVFTPPLNYIF